MHYMETLLETKNDPRLYEFWARLNFVFMYLLDLKVISNDVLRQVQQNHELSEIFLQFSHFYAQRWPTKRLEKTQTFI